MAKGDIAPQCHCFEVSDVGSGLGHFEAALGKGASKMGVFQTSLKVVELGMDDSDLVIIVLEADSISVEPPLGHVRVALEESVEGGSQANQEVVEPSRQRLGGSVVLDEGFGVDIGDEGSGRGPLVVSEHGNLSLSDPFDPLGGPKGTVGCWDDQGWVVPVVLNVSFGGCVERLLVMFHPVLQPKDPTVKASMGLDSATCTKW